MLTNFTYPQDIAYAITDLKDPMKRVTVDLPTKGKLMQENHLTLEKQQKAARNEDIEETIDYMRKAAFSEYNKRKTALTSNMAALWGQCSSSLQQVIKAEEAYDTNIYNPVWLLDTSKRLSLE